MPVFQKGKFIELVYEDKEIKKLNFEGHAKDKTAFSLRFHVDSVLLLLSLYPNNKPDGFFTLYADYGSPYGGGEVTPGIAFVPFKIVGNKRTILETESDYLIGACPPWAKTDKADNEQGLKQNPAEYYKKKWDELNPPSLINAQRDN